MVYIKKLIALLLCLIFISGCSPQESSETTAPATETEAVEVTTAATEPEPTTIPTETQTEPTVDKTPVTLSFGSGFGEYIDGLINSDGIIDVNRHDDGSVDITMEKHRYDEFVSHSRKTTGEALESLVGYYQTPYVEEVIYGVNFERVTLRVNRLSYQSSFDLTPLMVSQSCLVFQGIAGLKQSVDVYILDSETSEVLFSTNYSQ